jgi:hypothetical protein
MCVCACVRARKGASASNVIFDYSFHHFWQYEHWLRKPRVGSTKSRPFTLTPKCVPFVGEKTEHESQISEHMLSNQRIYIYIYCQYPQGLRIFGMLCIVMLVVVCPRFGTAYSYHLQGPSSPRRTSGRWWILYRVTHCIGSLKSLLPATSVWPYITLTTLIKMTCLASLFHSLWNSSDSRIQHRCHGRSIDNRHDLFCHELSLANCFLGGHEMILVRLIRWYI